MADEQHDDRQPDPISRGLDRWQVEMIGKMVGEYGHSWHNAVLLSAGFRANLEASFRQPLPLCVVTGL